ncbi:MAG TPA: transposase, partial [Verrucomicrobiota bacterium]|nr:transposase [Verrucomicrobiota bacterium]
MSAPVSLPETNGRFHEVLIHDAPAYLERFGSALPLRQQEVLQHLLRCRTPTLGGALFVCPECGLHHFRYHSCNDRHCPRCGQADADPWLARQSALLLPVDYFLVTFTVPEGLRGWMRSHPQLGYDALFAASAQALQDLAANPKRLGARLGMLGVLHTWSRTLIYHPHIHYLVPGGGLSLDGQEWIASRRGFLLRVEPLSDHCRTGFRQWLEREAPEALAQIPAKVWKQRWVTHSQAAGSGEQVLRYLSRYVFKTATGNRAVPRLPDGRVRWPYRESAQGRWRSLVLSAEELIRRFLQHVLPAGFHRVRRFGWWHPSAKAKREHLQGLLAGRSMESTDSPALAPSVPEEDADPFDELERAETFVEAHT